MALTVEQQKLIRSEAHGNSRHQVDHRFFIPQCLHRQDGCWIQKLSLNIAGVPTLWIVSGFPILGGRVPES